VPLAPEHVRAFLDPPSTWAPSAEALDNPLEHLCAAPAPCAATLVVCPVIALTQWRSEIARHCSSAQPLRVLIYHGPKRAVTAETLADFDVVLTTYSVLEVEWRKMVEPTKTACAYCGKAFLEAKLRVHLKYFCGPDSRRTVKQAKAVRAREAEGGGGGGGRVAVSDDDDSDADKSDGSGGDGSSGDDGDDDDDAPASK
jgi:hypothetical protein